MMLKAEEIEEEMIREAEVFHFGTLSMTDPIVEKATKKAIETAKESGCILSFDPNLRPPLWSSLDKAKEMIAYGMSVCDILKISDNEIEFMTGKKDIDEGIKEIRDRFGIPLIFATLGKDGSRAYYQDIQAQAAGFVNPDTIETTGAGDTFCACELNYVLEHGLEGLTKENLRDNMSTLELVLNMLAEATTTEISKQRAPEGFAENIEIARAGGKVAGDARKAVEAQTGVPVITSKNAAQLNEVVTMLIEDTALDTDDTDNK